MFDYYTKVHNMSEEKLVEEIQNLYKKLMSMNTQGTVYNQLLDMLDTATAAYGEKLHVSRFKNKEKDAVIDIGSINSETYIPDYSREELLLAVVEQYIKKDNL
jgi:tRNA A37 N6-isopentenylltransferase MiaA